MTLGRTGTNYGGTFYKILIKIIENLCDTNSTIHYKSNLEKHVLIFHFLQEKHCFNGQSIEYKILNRVLMIVFSLSSGKSQQQYCWMIAIIKCEEFGHGI